MNLDYKHSQNLITNFHSPRANRVLVVEDVAPERMRIQAMLEKQGFIVFAACQGEEALELIAQEDIGLILSDWRMPGMDGLSLLQAVKSQDGPLRYFILLTGQDALVDLVAAMDAGADDFITKPFNGEELRARIQAGSRLVHMSDLAIHRQQCLTSALDREAQLNATIQQDLVAAAQLQKSLLPDLESKLPATQIEYLYQPALTVAGDSFNVLPLADQWLGFYLIDVMGHGTKAAMHSFSVAQLLANANSHGLTLMTDGEPVAPASVLQQLNQRFLEEDDCQSYFTMAYGFYHCGTGHGQFSLAGHPVPLRCQGELVQSLGVQHQSLPIGVDAAADYQNDDFVLNPGERLMVYSDGLFNYHNDKQQAFNHDALCTVMAAINHHPLATVAQKLSSLLTGWHQPEATRDDVSCFFLEFNPNV